MNQFDRTLISRSEGDRYTIASYGFALPGKGLEELILSIAAIRQAGIDVQLKMINACYGDTFDVSRNYIARIRDAIAINSLEDYVELDARYHSNEESFEIISSADIVVFPYTKTGESGSAAVRLGLASGAIVAVTPLPIFDDIADSVYMMSGTSPHDIAESLIKLIKLMEADSDEVKYIRKSSELLVHATRYAKIGEFIDEEIKKGVYYDAFVDQFRLNLKTVHCRNGVVVKKGVCGGRSGILCYGPYENIQPGLYRVSVYGEMDENIQGYIRFGNYIKIIQEKVLRASANNVLADFMVELDEPMEGVEVVIWTEADGHILITDYAVAKKPI